MGYHIRPGLVKEHESILMEIAASIERGESISFPVAHPGLMEKTYYRFLRVLKATERLPEECGGRFADLRRRVILKQSWEQPIAVVVSPAVDLNTLIALKPSERDILSLLKDFTGKTIPITFEPSASFNEPAFIEAVLLSGFTLATSPHNGQIVVHRDLDTVTYVAERVKKLSGFDALDMG